MKMNLEEYEKVMSKQAQIVAFKLQGAIRSQEENINQSKNDEILATLVRRWMDEFTENTKYVDEWLQSECVKNEDSLMPKVSRNPNGL